MKCFLGIDIGTTGTKALLLAETGGIVAQATSTYPLLTPKANWAEQNPEDWWQAAISSVRECLTRADRSFDANIEVQAIGLTGQMHSTVFLNSDGTVLRPAILWCDQRTASQCREIIDTVGFDQLILRTSNTALPGFTAPKILWLRENEPEIYDRDASILLAKDYIRYRLSGNFATDVSDASGTLLLDVAERRWAESIIEALNIPRTWLPDCFESTDITGYVTTEAAGKLGLPEGIPVVAGGGDQAAGAVGNGVVHTGSASCVLGTSGAVFWHSDAHIHDEHGRLHAFCHAVPGKWHLMGVTLAAGGSLRWFRDTLCQPEIDEAAKQGIDPYDVIIEQAFSVPPGSEGLLFLPYLAGERTPHTDANARGAFIGLSLRHNKAHMARAVIEGITMSLKDCFELGKELSINPNQVQISGGGARSSLWRQMIADTLGVEVVHTQVDEGPAYGAAILAAVGTGRFRSVEEACREMVTISEIHQPNPLNGEIYHNIYGLYKPLYGTLKEHFARSASGND